MHSRLTILNIDNYFLLGVAFIFLVVVLCLGNVADVSNSKVDIDKSQSTIAAKSLRFYSIEPLLSEASLIRVRLHTRTESQGSNPFLVLCDTEKIGPIERQDDKFIFQTKLKHLKCGQMGVLNAGNEVLVVGEINIRNYIAINKGFPSFAILTGTKRANWPGWPVFLITCSGALAFLILTFLFSAHSNLSVPKSIRFCIFLYASLCISQVIAMFMDHAILIGWDFILLLSAMPLVVALLAYVISAAFRIIIAMLRKTPKWIKVAASRLWHSLPSLMPGIVLFIYIPLQIYLPNQIYFENRIYTIQPFVVAAIIWVLLYIISALLPTKLQKYYTAPLFFIGLFLLLNDMIIPVGLEELQGLAVPSNFNIPAYYSWVQILLFITLTASCFLFRWDKIKNMAALCVVFVCLSLWVGFSAELSEDTVWEQYVDITYNDLTVDPPANTTENGNIYQIVLDGYAGYLFDMIIHKYGLIEVFNGFKYFPYARTQYTFTHFSFPSFMSGSFVPVCNLANQGLLTQAYDNGYTVTQYLPRLRWWPNRKASNIYLCSDLQDSNSSLAFFADLVLFRAAPVFLKDNIFSENTNKGVFTSLIDEPPRTQWGYWAQFQFEQMADHEKNRNSTGEYVFMHVGIPHPPFIVDCNCDYMKEGWEHLLPDQQYIQQCACALNLVARFIARLKSIGRFKSSTIIVQSDHGISSSEYQNSSLYTTVTPEFKKMLSDYFGVNESKALENILCRGSALILVKAPGVGDDHPLVVNKSTVALVDIPQTIYETHNWPLKTKDGINLLSKHDSTRWIPYYFKLNNKWGSIWFNGLKWAVGNRTWKGPEQ